MMKMGKTQQQHGKWLSTLTVCTAALGSLVLLSVPQTASAATTDTSSAITGVTANPAATPDQQGSADTNSGTGSTLDQQGSTDTNSNADSTPAPAEKTADSQSTQQSSVNTDQLAKTSGELQTAVDNATNDYANVTQNTPKTITTTPANLADTVKTVTEDNAAQVQQLEDAKAQQDANWTRFTKAKGALLKGELTVTSSTNVWSDAQVVKYLAGEADAVTSTKDATVTDAEKQAVSDEVDAVSKVTLSDDAKMVVNVGVVIPGMKIYDREVDFTPISTGNPTWTYENAFKDAKTGREINVIETVTGYTEGSYDNGTKWTVAGIEIYPDKIGFTPIFTENVSATLQYVYADTGEPASIDAALAFADIDGNQGIKINNPYDSMLLGSDIENVDGVYRDTGDHTADPSDPENQIWVLQKDTTETDYTFYVGLKDNGDVNNPQPIQYIGGVDFAATSPDDVPLIKEEVSYTPTIINVATTYKVHYEGAGDQTPADKDTVVTWTGSYDKDTGAYTWTPDTTAVKADMPTIENYTGTATPGWSLSTLTTDPADQVQTITYTRVAGTTTTGTGTSTGTDTTTPTTPTTDTPTETGTTTTTTTPAPPAPSTAVATETPTETPTSTATIANGTAVTNNPTEPATTSSEQQNATSQASQGTNGQFHLIATTANASHATWQYAKSQATAQQTSNTAAATAQLPQTDEQTSTTSTLIGLGLLSLFFGLFGITRRKRQGNE